MPSIINTYDQHVAAGGDRIVIFRQVQDVGRGGHSASWQVGRYKNGRQLVTDPKAHFMDHGCKAFLIWGRHDVESKLADAIAWATEKYGAREFVKNRHGNYVEKEVNEKFPLPKRERKKKEQS